MTIRINDIVEQLSADMSLAAFLVSRGLDPQRVAVERNGAIVARGDFAQTILVDGDRLELLQFVGGG